MRGVKGTHKNYGDACATCKSTLTPENSALLTAPRQGLRSYCRLCLRDRNKRYRAKNSDAVNQRNVAYRKRIRQTVLDAYGNRCSCCGESHEEFLAVDHVNGGGTAQRRILTTSGCLYRFVIRNNFPSTFRLLCHNCNSSIGWYGYCPHQKDKNANP